MSESLLDGGESAAEPVDNNGGEPPVEPQDVAPSDDRPEWLPEKYKTGEDLAKAYKALESKLGSKEEDLRKSILEELQADAYKDRPASAGEYQLPDSIDPEMAVDNEMLKWWSETAFENGYSQEEFQKGIEMYAQSVMGNQPDLEAEAKKLGDNANDRIQAASAFATKFFPQEAIPAIERMCESAEGIIALESIMDALKDGNFSDNASSPAGLDEAKLREMMNDPRYWDRSKQDRDFIKQVDDGFAKLYR
jgi:hypothetical protein